MMKRKRMAAGTGGCFAAVCTVLCTHATLAESQPKMQHFGKNNSGASDALCNTVCRQQHALSGCLAMSCLMGVITSLPCSEECSTVKPPWLPPGPVPQPAGDSEETVVCRKFESQPYVEKHKRR